MHPATGRPPDAPGSPPRLGTEGPYPMVREAEGALAPRELCVVAPAGSELYAHVHTSEHDVIDMMTASRVFVTDP